MQNNTLTTAQARTLAIGEREEFLASMRAAQHAQDAQTRKVQILPPTQRVVSERVLAQRVAEIRAARARIARTQAGLAGVNVRELMNGSRRTVQSIVL